MNKGKAAKNEVIYPVAKELGWKVKKENNTPIQCSLIKSPTIFIEFTPRRKIELLMTKYPHQEWLGYLVGRISEKENYFVEDLVIPPHTEAYAASAEAEPFHIPDNCIGVIHSHHSMGAFHSGTDDTHVDRNFPISITVATGKGQGLEYDAVSHQTTPCGKDTTSKGVVKYVSPEPSFDTEAFTKGAVDNIDKGKRALYTHYESPYQQGRFPPAVGKVRRHIPVYPGEYLIGEGGEIVTEEEYQAALDRIWD